MPATGNGDHGAAAVGSRHNGASDAIYAWSGRSAWNATPGGAPFGSGLPLPTGEANRILPPFVVASVTIGRRNLPGRRRRALPRRRYPIRPRRAPGAPPRANSRRTSARSHRCAGSRSAVACQTICTSYCGASPGSARSRTGQREAIARA